MKHIYFLLALLCLGSFYLNAQTTYLGTGGTIPDNGPETCFDLTVCNSVTTLGNGGGQITLDFVCLDITHGWVEDRDIFLEAGGERYEYIPCLNDDPAHIGALASLVRKSIVGWETDSANTADETSRRAIAMGAPS